MAPIYLTKKEIDEQHKNSQEDLPKAYLIALWRSVPSSTTTRTSFRHYADMLEIYEAFLDTCKSPTIVNTFRATEQSTPTHLGGDPRQVSRSDERILIQKPLKCYPWEALLDDDRGLRWATCMAAAALELPYFLDPEYDSVGPKKRAEAVKEEVQLLVLGKKEWLSRHGGAFDQAAGMSLFIPPTR
jgi:hypothetical protein